MAKLININDALEKLCEFCSCGDYEDCDYRCSEFENISNIPAVDAVEVVRCRDCKHYEIHKPNVLENCERNGYLIPMKPDDFCSFGEKRGDTCR